MPDSGIPAHPDVISALWEMEKVGKNVYDFVIVHVNQIPGKGNKIDFEIVKGKAQPLGEAEKTYEGQDLGKEDPIFRNIKDILLSEYKNDGCFVQFYLNFNLEGNRQQNKLMLITWCPETTPMKKKMVLASTSKTLIKKAPHGTIGHTINDADDLNFKELTSLASAGKSN